jgi:dipeptidyl aminopeptidase/acylaminoacyl peptidase
MIRGDSESIAVRSRWLVSTLALALVVAAPTVADDRVGMSAQDIAAFRSVSQIALSPAGDRTAYTLTVQREPGKDEDGPAWTELHVIGEDGASRGYVTGEVRIERISWTADGSSILYLGRRGEDEKRRLYRIPIDGGEAREVMEYGDGLVEYAWSPRGDLLAFLAKPEKPEEKKSAEEEGFKQKVFEEEWRPVDLWVADIEDDVVGEPRQLQIEGSASEISFSPDGSRLTVALAPTSLVDDGYMMRRLHVLDVTSGEIVAKVDTSGKLGRIAWSPDGEHLALIGGDDAHDPAAARLMVVSSSGGTPDRLQIERQADAIDVAWLDARTLLWISAEGVDRNVEKMTIGGESEIVISGPGPIWNRLSLASHNGSLALVADTPLHPNEVFLGGVGGESPVRATVSNPWLAERRLADQEVISFTARDGVELQGLLINPLDRPDSSRVPLILTVHGGPEAHYANGWLTTYSRPGQVLAARGYAVFYPNYRGSTGRGLEFAKSSQADRGGSGG